MDDVVEQAKRLGALLAAHGRTKALREATAQVTTDAEAKRLEQDYAHAAEEMREREMAGAPIEPELKRRIVELGERIRRSPPLQRLLRANAEFGEMMDAVQDEISHAVGEALAPADEGGEGARHEGPGPEPEPPKKSILWTP
jgi:cell fate (sporulation/competence/biofilm development) regulator YlbF (YheA/YmcA/DUF963 family)